MFAILLASALAAPTHPVTLEAGLFEAASSQSLGAGVYSRVTGHLGSHWGLDVGLREGYLVGLRRTLGAVTAGVRYDAGPLYVRGGILHHHETPIELAKRFPVQTALGTHSGISHRTGAELSVGGDIPIVQQGYGGRLGVNLEVSVGGFPDPAGSAVYVFLSQAWTLDIGPRRE